MADLFSDEELADEETTITPDVEKNISTHAHAPLSQVARKRLEDLLEQKRLRDELDDYVDL